MSTQAIVTPAAPSSPLYSQGIRVGSTIWVSGMTGTDVAAGALAGATIQEQTRQALKNCVAIVDAGGGTVDDVVQVTVLLANPGDFAGMNEAYGNFFPGVPPTRAVTKLGVDLPGVLVSIMMIAQVDSASPAE